MTDMFARRAAPLLARAIEHFRVAIVNGPRQAGKSTLLGMSQASTGGTLLSLDDRTTLRFAKTDPAGLVVGFDKPTYIDEVQRGGDPLVLAVKAAVDRDQQPGQFVLAGSSRFLTVPTLSESLAGRARIIDLLPLSQGELRGGTDGLIDALFSTPQDLRRRETTAVSRRQAAEMVALGGFPSAVMLPSGARADWFEAYRQTLVLRDVAELRQLRRSADLPRLLSLAASRSAQELNVSSYAQALGMTPDTARDYLALLEVVYVHQLLPAWSTNSTSRAKQWPKLHFVDTGLLCDVRRLSAERVAEPTFAEFGSLLETFVVSELTKQRAWSEIRPDLYHFRDRDRREVDIVVESRDGLVAAIEVKAGVDVDERDTRGLVYLRDKLGDRFVNGVVIHLGDRPRALGDRLTAMPISALWV